VVNSQPELLAHHFTRAGQAVEYWYQAGRQAMARSAMVEAAAQLAQALDQFSALPRSSDRDHKELDLEIAFGAVLIATKGWAAPEVEKAYSRARELCVEGGDEAQLLAVLVGLFQHHLHWSSKLLALEIAEELLRLAGRTQDRSAQAVGHRCLGVAMLFNGQLLSATKHFERSLALYDRADRMSPVYLVGAENRVACLLFNALILLFQGYSDQAMVRSREALADAYKLAHAFTTSQTLYLTCWLHQIRREQRLVEERSRALKTLTAEHGLSAWAAHGAILHG
jgi:tetratricopeptide (TPR) repeat protein